MKVCAKRHHLITEVEEDAPNKTPVGKFGQDAQTSEVGCINGDRGFDLHAHNLSRWRLEHNINFLPLLRSEVIQSRPHRRPFSLLYQLHRGKAFHECTPQLGVFG